MKGWHNEKQRHKMSSKGIRSKGIVWNVNSVKRIERKVGWMSRTHVMTLLKEHGFSLSDDTKTEDLKETLLMSVVNGTISEFDLQTEDYGECSDSDMMRYTL